MHYTSPYVNLGGLGAAPKNPLEALLCAPDEEFCDDTCVRYVIDWQAKNPADDACLTEENRRQLIDVCTKVHQGVMTPTQSAATVRHFMEDPCLNHCKETVREWAANYPQDAVCVGAANMHIVVDMCLAWKAGTLGEDKAQATLATLIAEGCPPTPPSPLPQPPPPQTIPEPFVEEVTVYTAPPITLQEKPSAFRTWGPVVGALLIVGGGIYLLR